MPGSGRPIDSGAARARSGGSTLIRAVASVAPYITKRSKPAALAELGDRAHPLGGHPAAGLGERPHGRHVAVGEAGPLEQLEGVRDARDRGDAVLADQVPEALVDDGQLGEQQPGAAQQVAVQHREAVAVVQGQGGRREVGVADAEGLGDGRGVGQHAVAGQAHQLGRAGRAAGREQQREVGVQRVPGLLRAPLAALRAGDDVGCVGLLQPRGGGRRGDQDDLLGGQGGDVLDDGVHVVARREEHEPATPGVRRGDLLDAAGEVGVRDRAVGGDQGPSLAEGGEVGDEGRRGRAHLGGGGHPPDDRR